MRSKKGILVLLPLFMVLAINAQEITGRWEGSSDEGIAFRIGLSSTEQNMLGYADVQYQGTDFYGYPLEELQIVNDSLSFRVVLNGREIAFDGKINPKGNAINGKMYINRSGRGSTLTFTPLAMDSKTPYPETYHIEKPAKTYTHQDTLRGSITPERAWWDLVYYDLDVKVDINKKFISGTNRVYYTVLGAAERMQIDLQPPMKITEVTQDGKPIEFDRDGNVYYIHFPVPQRKGSTRSLLIAFEGKPKVAVNAPWDGGFSWSEDDNGKPFVATSCQNLGASVWWPCKDHMYDEPDSMKIAVTVPGDLTGVSNGRLTSINDNKDGTRTFHWKVSNPINNYGVNVNIGDYAHFSEVYQGVRGPLDCNYYVLKDNLEKAKEQFSQVTKMLEAFEYWFGPYPFYEDGYKLVEVPYLGMEHQSSITYGNGYGNGYRGRDLSGTGWGLKFDFIIIHESGHEWFANSITYKDIADMWIHESFINYSEGLYLEYHYGKEAAFEYLRGIRQNIDNDIPVIGDYNVNQEGSGDMYAKGASMLHTIRQLVGNDQQWREMLLSMNKKFFHQTVTTEEIENFMSTFLGMDLSPVFDQYLRTVMVPTLEYYIKDDFLSYRWINAVDQFNMPVKVNIGGNIYWLKPRRNWSYQYLGNNQGPLIVDPDFYVAYSDMLGETGKRIIPEEMRKPRPEPREVKRPGLKHSIEDAGNSPAVKKDENSQKSNTSIKTERKDSTKRNPENRKKKKQ